MEQALCVGITTKEALPVNWNVGAVGDTEMITRSTVHSCLCLQAVLHIGVPDNNYLNHVLQHTFYIWQEHELFIVMESFDRDLCDIYLDPACEEEEHHQQ